MRHHYKGYHQLTLGISLLEVMLTSALAVLMISALTNFYIKLNHAVLRNQEYIADSLTAARLIALFRSEIESAGHIGCAELSDDFNITPYQQYAITKANSLQVHDNELIVKYQAMPTLSLVAPLNKVGTMLTDDGAALTANEIMLISDCRHAELFQVKSVNRYHGVKHITSTKALLNNYEINAEIGRYISHRYYLKTRGTNSYLMEEDSRGISNILQSDVSDLQFLADKDGVAYSFQYKNTFWSSYATTS